LRKKMLITCAAFLFILLVMPAVAQGAVHTVKRGETLWSISQQYNTTVTKLAQENGIANVSLIYAGQTLRIPGTTTRHTVRPGETLWLISRHYGINLEALLAHNKELKNPDYIEVGQVIFVPRQGVQAAAVPSRSSAAYSAAELDLFARLVNAEAGGEPYTGQVAVAASVLNRLKDPNYPNTLSAVIYQVTNGCYQYSPVLDGRISLPANQKAYQAVYDALSGWDPSLNALGFYNSAKTSNQWVRQQQVTTVIGNHIFFR